MEAKNCLGYFNLIVLDLDLGEILVDGPKNSLVQSIARGRVVNFVGEVSLTICKRF